MSIEGRYKFNEAEHIHELDGKPLTGTSSVLSIIAKPLTWWASGEAVKTLGWTPITEYVNGKPRAIAKKGRIESAKARHEHIKGLDAEGYIDALDEAYKAHSRALASSAGKGKDLHSLLEKYVKFSLQKNEGSPANIKSADIQPFIEWAIDNVDKFLWSEMHTYSEKEWLGGITDAGALMKDGKIAIIDFKSSKAAYKNQFWQIGGYQIQIEENGGYTRKGEDVIGPTKIDKHIIIPFGAPTFAPEEQLDTNRNVAAFRAALTLYRANQDES